MRGLAGVRRLLATLVLAAALPAAAAPFAVQLGAERVVLDAPLGFADTGNLASPRLQEVAEALTSASYRILLFAIADEDLRRFMTGDRLEMRRYMIVATPRALERERVTERQFEVLVLNSLPGAGPAVAPADAKKHLDGQPHGATNSLAELQRGPGVVSLLQGTRLPSQGGGWREAPAKYLLSTSTLLLVRGKALQLAVYTAFDTPADMSWASAVTRQWIDDLLRLNGR
jgi:hypothetical protein